MVIALTVILKKKMGISVSRQDFWPRREATGQIVRIGLPIALQDGLIQVAFIIITIIANRRGLSDAAAVGIVEKIISFFVLVPSSQLFAVSPSVHRISEPENRSAAVRTLYYSIGITVGFGVIISIIIQFVAAPVVGLFTADAAVVVLGTQYIRGYIWDCIFAGIHFSFSGYFCAIGRSELSFIHNITAIVLVRVPGVYLTSKLFPDTLFPMGLATVAGSLTSVVICLIAFHILKRQKKVA